jgi:hypothetical protein
MKGNQAGAMNEDEGGMGKETYSRRVRGWARINVQQAPQHPQVRNPLDRLHVVC